MRISKATGYFVKFSVSIFLIGIFLLFSAFWYFSAGLPDYKKLSNYEPSVLSRVYTDNGELVAEYALEKRLFIPYDSIPKKVILYQEHPNFSMVKNLLMKKLEITYLKFLQIHFFKQTHIKLKHYMIIYLKQLILKRLIFSMIYTAEQVPLVFI